MSSIRPVRLAILSGLLAVIGTFSCRDGATDPRGRLFTFAVVPAFQSSRAAGLVDVDRIQFVVTRADESIVLDTIVDIPVGSSEVQLDLTVTVTSPDELFLLTLTLFDPSGSVVFVGGPIEVSATAAEDTPPPPLEVPLVYTGVGANAVAVQIVTPDTALYFGEVLAVTADALDDAGQSIPGTPIGWSSVDPSLADVPDETVGEVNAGSARGVARIVATLLTGPADTVSIGILASPGSVVAVTGDQQRALVGTSLPEIIAVQVRAADGLAVSDVVVDFAASDGSLSANSDTTDAQGLAQTAWTLGSLEGQQTISVSLPDFPQVATSVVASAVFPNALIPVSDGQRGAINTPVPAVSRVVAADGLGIEGIAVEFRSAFGTVSPTAATSGIDGLAQTTWTLGGNTGNQTIDVTLPDYLGITTTMTTTAFIPPPPGTDIVVFNDMNMFDSTAMQDPNNQRLVRNLVGFTSGGSRSNGTVVWFDRGRNSTCFNSSPPECTASTNATMIAEIQSMGLAVLEASSDTLPDLIPPPEVKAIFLWNPAVPFDSVEITLAQQFAAEGGRIVFVGEWDGFYGQAGIDTENQFLLDMGAQMTNTGGAVDCGYNVLPPSSILLGHQVTTGLTGITIACASIITPGPQDFPIMFDLSNTLVLGGVAQIGPLGAPPAIAGDTEDRADAAVPVRPRGLDPRSGAGIRR